MDEKVLSNSSAVMGYQQTPPKKKNNLFTWPLSLLAEYCLNKKQALPLILSPALLGLLGRVYGIAWLYRAYRPSVPKGSAWGQEEDSQTQEEDHVPRRMKLASASIRRLGTASSCTPISPSNDHRVKNPGLVPTEAIGPSKGDDTFALPFRVL